MKCMTAFLALILATPVASAARDDRAKLSDLAEQALRQSQLTLPGSRPFHLQATLVETTNPKSDYQARIEEFWISPAKWRRTITSPGFSQTLIVNGDQVSEKNTGDYFPWWLDEFVTAIFNPLPMLEALKQTNSDMPTPGANGLTQTCADLHERIDRWVICFDGHRLLTSIFTKGYAAEFKDYKKFGDKLVARTIENDPESGTHLRATITHIDEIEQPDDLMFATTDSTSPENRIQIVRIDEDALRKLALSSTEIDWPSIGGGLTRGYCALFVSVDRLGRVREVWPEGCDNAGVEDGLRDQVRKWRLLTSVSEGVPVQVTSLITFTFNAPHDSSKLLPDLTEPEVRALAFHQVDPVFSTGVSRNFAEVVVNISVDERGRLTGMGPANETPNDLLFVVFHTLEEWRFHPYILNGKPQYFHGTLTFPVR